MLLRSQLNNDLKLHLKNNSLVLVIFYEDKNTLDYMLPYFEKFKVKIFPMNMTEMDE